MSAERGRSGLRLDKWLWHARFVRRRELAAVLVAERRIRLNGQPVVKTHQLVRPGDVLVLTERERIRVVRVKELGSRREGAAEAAALYELVSSEP
ncbi:MAG: S4 domain-containing protein [Geminicoccaceae bacterium]|nr:S4 domain-containing protein [Geminicoccaceae bacterium]MCS7268688.1 S4 domain-containing protein [Geminicoccaceae bacterium]MCX7630227.1 S4 domain-containing protein [Geminicoccaceae bacterium]MDW8125832.1 S4 domain-containing protein [Geminicoccaceae bacterium]MDW8341495.1 S4 domain-containing protein [Geminicoccaceae bacterium]